MPWAKDINTTKDFYEIYLKSKHDCVSGTTSPATMPELPRSLSNIVDRSSSYKDNRNLPTFKRRKEHKRFKTDARPERKMSPKGMKSEAAASV